MSAKNYDNLFTQCQNYKGRHSRPFFSNESPSAPYTLEESWVSASLL